MRLARLSRAVLLVVAYWLPVARWADGLLAALEG